MSQFNTIAGRVSSLLSSDRLMASLRRTQTDLLNTQDQISTGLKVNAPSDAPADTSSILSLQNKLESREQFERNLQFSLSLLNNTDQGLADAFNIVLESHDIASSQVGVGSSAQERQNQSHVIDAQIKSLVEIANRQIQGVSLFGGRHSTAEEPIFIETLGGIRYVGADEDLAADVGLDAPLGFNTNGHAAFGALSTRVKGKVDLDPQATASTQLSHMNGAQSFGIRKGSVVVAVDGNAVTVDLATADNLGDVVTRVNDAINGVDPTAGALSIGTTGLSLTANPAHTIAIDNLGTGQTASDLGIVISATGGSTAGADIDPRLTELTSVAALGVPVDLTSGLKITQGNQTKIADFSAATTIQDLINVVDQLNLGLRMEINDDGTGLNLVTEVSGIELSVGENTGGTTASDLGVRTFDGSTLLSDFRHGIGVTGQTGADDFAFHLHDGTTFNVNIDGVTTVGELITAIQNAAVAGGSTVGAPGAGGTDFNVGLASDGNGLLFEDGTAGANDFRVTQLGLSLAATDLGIYTNAGSGSTINGQDLATVRVENVFTHMIALRDSLVNNDSSGITFAGGGLESDLEQLTRARADVGVRSQRVEQQKERSSELKISEQVLLSQLRDTDLAEAITTFTQLQQQLQASLLVGSQNLQLSLLNFLR